MEIKDLIKLYINDLERKVKESPARNARINMLKDELEAINYTHCCTELNDKESIDFEDWKLVEKVKCAYGKYFIGNKEFSYKQLIKEYTSYKRSL
jgi:hypothetical protein